MKIIKTNKGEEILVSDEDYPLLSRHTWGIDNGGYPRISILGKHIRMHQLVCPAGLSMVTDHINRDKLDNRRENLRIVTRSENRHNSKDPTGETGYINVYRDKTTAGSYYGVISHNNKKRYIPYSKDAKDVAAMRDYIAWNLRGDYAVLNFPEVDYSNFDHVHKHKLDCIVDYLGK